MGAAEKIQQEIEEEQERGAIIFLPSAIVPESFYRPVIEKIWLTDNDIYSAQSKIRVRYEGLLKLANAAGIEWSAPDSGRADNGGDKLYVAFRAVGLIRKADGKLYPTASSYDLDLELVKEELEEQYRQKAKTMNNKSDQEKEDYIQYCVSRDWLHKRKHKVTLAESGAKARVIRSILGLQSQYSNKEDITGRPFVIVRFVLDHQNPDIKQAMLAAAQENMSAIYGNGSLPQALPRFESAAAEGDVIDLPFKPENTALAPDAPLYPKARANLKKHPDVPFENEMNSMALDFENSDIDVQVRTLEDLCKKKNYDLNNYLKQTKCGLHQLSSAKRLEFFNYLNTL